MDRKRSKPSGAQFRKKRKVEEEKRAKDKGALLKYFGASSATAQDEPPTAPVSQDEEEPSTSSAAQASSEVVPVLEDEHQSMSPQTSPSTSASLQHEPSEMPGAECPTAEEPLSTDPAKWPTLLTDRIRTELVRRGPLLAEEEPQPRYLEDSLERVVGGEVARPNSWPWQISLQFQSGSNYHHTCGGSLIRRGWVMTAAHCVDSQRTWRVVVGEHNLNSNEGREQYVSVSRVYIHPNWNRNQISNGYDIALLRLSNEVTLNNYVQLANLPPSGQVLNHNHPCYISGWGRTTTGGNLSAQLKQAYLPVVDHNTCSSSGWWGNSVRNTMVCAGGGKDSGCQGDSGGPLNCQLSGRYYVHGVTSFVSARACNESRKPTVFTRVSAYIGWMENIMG